MQDREAEDRYSQKEYFFKDKRSGPYSKLQDQ
jgi:hypothetical protein